MLLDLGEPLGERLTAPFEEPYPGLGRQVPEEGNPNAEPRILRLALLRWLLEQLEEVLFPLLGDRVDGLAPGTAAPA